MAWTSPYDADAAFTQTALDGLATSSTLVAGWTSDSVTTAADDYLIAAQFQVASAGLSVGRICLYAYTILDDTPTWPDAFSAGTEGSQGAATIHDTEVRDAGFILLWAADTDTSASRFYFMPQTGMAQFFGGVMPERWALFVTHSTGAALATSGDPNQIYRTPIIFAGP